MARKKKTEERTCATCGRGPDKDKCMDKDDCSRGDLWFPKPPECDGESCKISVNGGPAVPFPSKEATEQVTEMVKGHLEEQGVIPKTPKQLDLEMKPACVIVDEGETETVTYRKFDLGKFKAKIREDKIYETTTSDLMGFVRKKVKVAGDKPVLDGEWDAACHALHKQLKEERGA